MTWQRHKRISIMLISLFAVSTLTMPVMAQNAPTAVVAPDDFVPVWVVTMAPTDAWPGPQVETGSFGTIPLRTPLQVLAPQLGGRLYVMNSRTNGTAWVDAGVVAPIPDPTPEDLAAYLAPLPFESWWAMPFRPTASWSGPEPEATETGRVRQWLYLRVTGPEENGRIPTEDPRTQARTWVEIADIGPVGEPPAEYLAPAPPDTDALSLPGRIIGNPFAYDHPQRADHFALSRLSHNQAVTVQGYVDQGEAGRWYRFGDTQYVHESNLRLPRRPERTFPGRWIDANLNEPVLVTAYEGDRPVYSALAVKGTTAFQTPIGVHRIQRRVANETMDSATIGIPRNAPLGYYLRDVLYTQYFTGDGAAIHYNYWRSDWGYSGSKGCLGMNLDDSRFFWDFAGVGTVVSIHF